MAKEIAQKIRAGYGDMRKSEQKAADFIPAPQKIRWM